MSKKYEEAEEILIKQMEAKGTGDIGKITSAKILFKRIFLKDGRRVTIWLGMEV